MRRETPSATLDPLYTMNTNRMLPPEGPGPAGLYEPSWRPTYQQPSFDNHADSRRSSTNGLPNAPVLSPHEIGHSPHYRPMNGVQDTSPEYHRPRMAYTPHDQIPSGDHTPSSATLPPTSQFMQPSVQMGMATTTAPSGYEPSPAFYQNGAGSGQGQRQRKAQRATQACDQCRTRKAKCDEGRPVCGHCHDNDLKCVYKEVPPHKQDKTTQILSDRLTSMEEGFQSSLSQLEESVKVLQGTVVSFMQGMRSPPDQMNPPIQSRASHVPSPLVTQHDRSFKQEPPSSTPVLPDHESQEMDSPTEPEGELSIPLEHNTAAHKLLLWPSIHQLLLPAKYDENYVMRLEEERGLISIYGQGENAYTVDGSELPFENGFRGPQPDVGGDADVEVDKFGTLNLDVGTATRYYQSFLDHMFKLHPFIEQMELDRKVHAFMQCYCRMNTPPSSASTMRAAWDGPPPAKRRRSNEHFSVGGEYMQSVPNAPRRYVDKNIDNALVLMCFALGAICELPAPLPGPITDQKIDYRDQYIPGPMPPAPEDGKPYPPQGKDAVNYNSGSSYSGSYASNDVISPANSNMTLLASFSKNSKNTSPIQTHSPSLPPAPGEIRKNLSSRSLSHVRDDKGNTKNSQVIAGLTMYGYATSILGTLQGGNELEHIQTALLAGLYAGQLAHPLQSHSWIYQAARGCQVLVSQKRYSRCPEGLVRDLYEFAYWTCLQLESDLLAELDIPASGISRVESKISLPTGRYFPNLPNNFTSPATLMLLCYSAQVYLRKVLNRVHTDLYKVENGREPRWTSSVQEALKSNLDSWRRSLPESMIWDDEKDPPASDINVARMRAKYYGGYYIIHRPLLYHALHYGNKGARIGPISQPSVNSPTYPQQQNSPSVTLNGSRSSDMLRRPSDKGSAPPTPLKDNWSPPKVKLKDLPKKLREGCKTCIKSAIRSTEALDGVAAHRLVVTNIFGTAHAQFGNMLVLSATYQSYLSELVEKEVLERLLKRTIKFLLQNENISPTLRADARILTEIYQKIFKTTPDLSSQIQTPATIH